MNEEARQDPEKQDDTKMKSIMMKKKKGSTRMERLRRWKQFVDQRTWRNVKQGVYVGETGCSIYELQDALDMNEDYHIHI